MSPPHKSLSNLAPCLFNFPQFLQNAERHSGSSSIWRSPVSHHPSQCQRHQVRLNIMINTFLWSTLSAAEGKLNCLKSTFTPPPTSLYMSSELREIPDNQEVFAHDHSDQSIIVELLELQNHVQNEDAARYAPKLWCECIPNGTLFSLQCTYFDQDKSRALFWEEGAI